MGELKILFISGLVDDYLANVVLHGGRSILGANFVDMNKSWQMYDTAKGKLHDTYGRGFTLYGTLQDIVVDRDDILTKIQHKFFDYIIYGCVHRDMTHINDVIKNYPKERIAFLDGEDGVNFNTELLGKGIYFKRELRELLAPDVYPISFGVPKNLIVDKVPEKTKPLSCIVPGDKYKYDNQDDYYKEYQSSIFAITKKKGGWDCMRHYEILMNGCIPYFMNLANCPELTMNNFPKQLVLEAQVADEALLFMHENSIYKEYAEKLLDYTRNNLTTEHIFNMVMSKLAK